MRCGKGSLVRLWYKTALCGVEPVALKEQRSHRKDERLSERRGRVPGIHPFKTLGALGAVLAGREEMRAEGVSGGAGKGGLWRGRQRGGGSLKVPDRPWGARVPPAGRRERGWMRVRSVSETLTSGLRCFRFCIAVTTFLCLLYFG